MKNLETIYNNITNQFNELRAKETGAIRKGHYTEAYEVETQSLLTAIMSKKGNVVCTEKALKRIEGEERATDSRFYSKKSDVVIYRTKYNDVHVYHAELKRRYYAFLDGKQLVNKQYIERIIEELKEVLQYTNYKIKSYTFYLAAHYTDGITRNAMANYFRAMQEAYPDIEFYAEVVGIDWLVRQELATARLKKKDVIELLISHPDLVNICTLEELKAISK